MRHTMISVAKADVPEELFKRTVHSRSIGTFGVGQILKVRWSVLLKFWMVYLIEF